MFTASLATYAGSKQAIAEAATPSEAVTACLAEWLRLNPKKASLHAMHLQGRANMYLLVHPSDDEDLERIVFDGELRDFVA